MNNKYTSKSICLYTFPIILSELLEEIIILSDSILLSFKDPLYLSTVGVIDSIFLLFLVVGDSMNDSFQNFYSRHSGSISRCKYIFSYSLPLFTGVGLISAALCSLIPFIQWYLGKCAFCYYSFCSPLFVYSCSFVIYIPVIK